MGKSTKMVEAGKKAWRTRRINALEREYDRETSAGKKAAIRRQINKIKNG